MAQDSPEDLYVMTLELTRDQKERFEACRQALDHDEPEQTANLMINMLIQAIALTSKENSMVYLYVRDKHKTEFTHVICPDCKKEIAIVHQVSDGFRETGFKLIP